MADNEISQQAEIIRLLADIAAEAKKTSTEKEHLRSQGIRFLESSRAMIRLFGKLSIAKHCFLDDAVIADVAEWKSFSFSRFIEQDAEGNDVELSINDDDINREKKKSQSDIEIKRTAALKLMEENFETALTVCETHLETLGEFLPIVRLKNYQVPQDVVHFEYEPIEIYNADPDRVSILERHRKRFGPDYSSAHHLIFNLMVRALDELYPFDSLKLSEGKLTDVDGARQCIRDYVSERRVFDLYKGLDYFPEQTALNRIHRIAYHEQLAVAQFFDVLNEEMSSPPLQKLSHVPSEFSVDWLLTETGWSDKVWRRVKKSAGLPAFTKTHRMSADHVIRALHTAIALNGAANHHGIASRVLRKYWPDELRD